jgi:hypothetical protein
MLHRPARRIILEFFINIAHLCPEDLGAALPLPLGGTAVPEGGPQRGPPCHRSGFGSAVRRHCFSKSLECTEIMLFIWPLASDNLVAFA